MILGSCSCGALFSIPWESGDPMGFCRVDCACGKFVLVECTSIGGEVLILDSEQELERLVKDRGLGPLESLPEPKEEAPEWKDFNRASGEVPCETCGLPLYQHKQPVKETCPTMVEDCLGRWWKL